MLESEIHNEHDHGEDQCGNQHEDGRALQLAPRRPRDLLGQFLVGFLQIVNELSHLSF